MHHRRRGGAAVGSDRRQRALQRLGQHHHARPAAEGAVVDPSVGVLGEVAQRPQAHIDLRAFDLRPKARRVTPWLRCGANSSGNSVTTSKRIVSRQ